MKRFLSLILALCLIASMSTVAMAASKPAAKRAASKDYHPYTAEVNGLLTEEDRDQFFTLTLDKPSKVLVELTTYSPETQYYGYKEEWVYLNNGGYAWPRTFKFTYYLDDGDYDFNVYSSSINPYDDTANKFRLKITSTELELDETHVTSGYWDEEEILNPDYDPNDPESEEYIWVDVYVPGTGSPLTITDSKTIKGAITQDDSADTLLLSLAAPKQVKLEFTNTLHNCELQVPEAGIYLTGHNSKSKLSKARKSTFTAQMPAGDYEININQGWDKYYNRLYDTYSPYTLKVTLSEPVTPAKLPRTITVGAGSNTSRVVPFTNYYNRLDASVTFSVADSGAGRVEVDPNTGMINAISNVTTRVTATPAVGASATATLKVIDNKISRKYPLYTRAKALFVSVKSMAYNDAGELEGELFVLNKTGYDITDLSSFTLNFFSPYSAYADFDLGTALYKPEAGTTYAIKKGRYAVIPFKIIEPGQVMDLVGTFGVRPTLNYLHGYTEGTATPKGIARTFKVVMLNSGDKGVFSDKKARPAPVTGASKAWTTRK